MLGEGNSMNKYSSGRRLFLALLGLMLAPTFYWSQALRAEGGRIECPSPPPAVPSLARSESYKGVPFQAGESATYEVFYGGMLAGTGDLEVKPAIKFKGAWHRQFHAHARTGEWYKLIFVAEDKVQSISRPWDFGIAKFYMEQDEGKLFGSRLVQKKWLDFDHDGCKVAEKVWKPSKADELSSSDLNRGAIDALGAVFKLRTFNYQVGKTERFMVYTDTKNWWLEAQPIAREKVTVKAGTFDAMKLKLQTYLGKDLQQKGEVFVWIDQGTPSRPLVQIKGDIKIGSVWLELASFSPGAAVH